MNFEFREINGTVVIYLALIAEKIFIGLGGEGSKIFPLIDIFYSPEDRSIALKVVQRMKDEGFFPKVYLGPLGDKTYVAVIFTAPVDYQFLTEVLKIDKPEYKNKLITLVLTGETEINNPGPFLEGFRAGGFFLVTLSREQGNKSMTLWEVLLNSYEDLPDDFGTQGR